MYDTIIPVYEITMPFGNFLIWCMKFINDFSVLFFSFLGLKLGLSLLRYATE